MANRHLSRVIVMQTLFEWDFRPTSDLFETVKRNILAYDEECDVEYIDFTLKGVIDNLEEIDKIITTTAPEWPIEQIAVIDKAILRVSVYELLFGHNIPPKVVINEAVELGKTYGSENSYKFINGVLGTLYKQDDRVSKEIEEKIHNEQGEELKSIPELNEDVTLLDLHDAKSMKPFTKKEKHDKRT